MAQKNAAPIQLLVVVIILLLCVGAYFAFQNQQDDETLVQANLEEQEQVDVVTEQSAGPITVIELDVESAAAERILGNPDAPVRISEHSSFTCGHCGQFHQKTFKTFKEQWIDTGRAYLVFSDFPLNGPALHASMVARCVPQDEYFDYVQMLFETQEDWAYDVGYQSYLKRTAAERGLDGESFDSCLQNEDLRDAILDRVRASQVQFDINSTPSFVVDNNVTISGALSYAEFEAQLLDAIAGPVDGDAPLAPALELQGGESDGSGPVEDKQP